ncbi:MAG: menaquinone biosynthesis protein [Mucinivorans sp.]
MVVVAVKYLNTLPMIWGIEQAAFVSNGLREGLLLAVPSECARLIKAKQADISLVPVAEIPDIEGGQIITDYCISADLYVRTVVLLTNESRLDHVHTIYLDTHSCTSVQLVRILSRELWHITPQYVDGLPATLGVGEAMVAIGDKVFDLEDKYRQNIDLAQSWRELTGLPFVFAAWVARTTQGVAMADELNSAIGYGVSHIEDAVNSAKDAPADALQYLTYNIKYNLTSAKRLSMELFWEKLQKPG